MSLLAWGSTVFRNALSIKHFIFYGFLFTFGCQSLNHKDAPNDYVKLVDWYPDDIPVQYLDKRHVHIKIQNHYIVLYNNEKTVDGLIDLLGFLRLQMDIISDNIANATTTRSANGGPYTRRFVDLDSNGSPHINEDKKTPFRYVYDPGHPDAIKQGRQKGYVKYPNVSSVTEMVNMMYFSKLYSQVSEILDRFDPHIILSGESKNSRPVKNEGFLDKDQKPLKPQEAPLSVTPKEPVIPDSLLERHKQ